MVTTVFRAEISSSPCGELVRIDENHWEQCRHDGLVFASYHDRRDGCGPLYCRSESRCYRHGARLEALLALKKHECNCWYRLAPESVPRELIIPTGCMSLASEQCCLVLRQIDRGRWIVQLGVGSHLRDLRKSYATRETALEAGERVWRNTLDARIEEIRIARGGTLDWGVPVVPRNAPMLLEPMRGESAWDAMIRAEHLIAKCA